MPIIDKVGRKTKSVKLLIILMYTVLIIGGITMVYPFILMLSSSITTSIDYNDFRIIPKYLFDDEVLYRKYLYDKYNGTISASIITPGLNTLCQTDYIKFETIPVPKLDFSSKEVKDKLEDFAEFKANLSSEYKQAGFLLIIGKKEPGKVIYLYRKMLSGKFKGDIQALNRYYNDENENFKTIEQPGGRYLAHIWKPDRSVKWKEWLEFEKKLPEKYKYIISCDGLFQTWLSIKYQNNIELLNKEYKTQYASFQSIVLSGTPKNVKEKQDWLEYVRTKLPLKYLGITGAENIYRNFLQNKYKDIAKLNKLYNMNYKSFSELKLIEDTWLANDAGLIDWNEFIGSLPADYLYVRSADNLYREFLINKYKNIETLNSKYKTEYKDFSSIRAPYIEGEYFEIIKNKNFFRKYFLLKNYTNVLDYILLHGRAVLNTVIFCALTMITVLIVNPLCAYALSRFNLRYTQKILLFLLATMAFPTEVSLIPNFLLLKKLGMLNTYWALFLPGIASGFSIFLLKGFFDSLPKELYESGSIDGASEMTMFFKITLPLAKPVLAYIALGAFISAYGAFMYALIVCQNPDMWTIMVWLYDMQNWAPPAMQMAGYVIATIPTLLVFIFAQNIIMRGIILPVEH